MNVGDRSIDEFCSDVASERVAPAGGTAAAVVGAVGASLCEMGCIHSADGEQPTADAGLQDTGDELHRLRGRLLELGTEDARVVDDVFASGSGVDEAGAKRVMGVPMATAEACLQVVQEGTTVVAECTPTAVADARAGVILAHAALRASLSTVRENVTRIDDPSYVEEIQDRATEIEATAAAALEGVPVETNGSS